MLYPEATPLLLPGLKLGQFNDRAGFRNGSFVIAILQVIVELYRDIACQAYTEADANTMAPASRLAFDIPSSTEELRRLLE